MRCEASSARGSLVRALGGKVLIPGERGVGSLWGRDSFTTTASGHAEVRDDQGRESPGPAVRVSRLALPPKSSPGVKGQSSGSQCQGEASRLAVQQVK